MDHTLLATAQGLHPFPPMSHSSSSDSSECGSEASENASSEDSGSVSESEVGAGPEDGPEESRADGTDSYVGTQCEDDSEGSESEARSSTSSSKPPSSVSRGEALLAPRGEAVQCGSDMAETWEDHLRKHGKSHDCGRCLWMRNRHRWRPQLVYRDREGGEASWIEERSTAVEPWALGCKICRWRGMTDIWGTTSARGQNCKLNKLKRHATAPSHARAQQALLQVNVEEADLSSVVVPDDRHDVPCFAMCFAAWQGALKGAAFSTYSSDLQWARSAGAPIPRSRESRMTACQLVTCFGDVLRAEDAALLRHATHIHLTMDARKGHIVVRARMTLSKLPPNMRQLSPTHEADGLDCPRVVRNITGEHILRADRLLSFQHLGGYTTTQDLADTLVSSLEEACKGDEALWEDVRHKVYAFTPDGAADEQLAGRLCGGGQSPPFPNLRLVLRCSAHAVQGAIKAGWAADELSDRLTKSVVQEVAKYIRSSDRFAARLTSKQVNETVAALSNFSFAPQRFGSRDRPLSRFAVFSKSILEALCLEVSCPTSASRKQWALKILNELDTSAWLMISMLADLADDCTRFVRQVDQRRSDPVEFWERYTDFRDFLKQEYVQGRMWLRSETYASRMVKFIEETRVVEFGKQVSVLRKPTKRESRLCQAHVANVADGILKYLRGQLPDFCAQAHFACFKLGEQQPQRLRELLTILGWTDDKANRCVKQYVTLWPHAKAIKREGQLPDSESWAAAIAKEVSPSLFEELRDVLGVLVSFLISETECERNFAVERKQFDHRPRLSPEMRFNGLKVMVDGVPLASLQCGDGQPLGDFFPVVQSRYAERCPEQERQTVRNLSQCRAATGSSWYPRATFHC